jgi:hypothetical protein
MNQNTMHFSFAKFFMLTKEEEYKRAHNTIDITGYYNYDYSYVSKSLLK